MLCPYRVRTIYEYAVIGASIVKDKDITEFEKCAEKDCPLYDTYLCTCARARKEINEAENY